MNQRLIRYDVRSNRDDYVTRFWDEERRNLFLLRPDIDWPLSIDPVVWPSIFFSRIFRDSAAFPDGRIEVDAAIDGGDYWLNLEQMRKYYEEHRLPSLQGTLVSIHLFSDRDLTGDILWYRDSKGNQCGMRLGRTDPQQAPQGSEFLGYDVADASWISSLTNCGYSRKDKEELQQKWAARLNGFGLLKSYDDAAEFRNVSDARIQEHAPFWVFGISGLGGWPTHRATRLIERRKS